MWVETTRERGQAVGAAMDEEGNSASVRRATIRRAADMVIKRKRSAEDKSYTGRSNGTDPGERIYEYETVTTIAPSTAAHEARAHECKRQEATRQAREGSTKAGAERKESLRMR